MIHQDRQEPSVAVVIPVYNAEETIGDCIESICAQSKTDIELIIVDDGSRDGSYAVCRNAVEKDNRIKVVRQKNMGRTVARRKGTDTATAAWIAYVDADDILLPNALKKLYDKATDEVDIVLGGGETLGNNFRSQIGIDDFRHLAVRGEGTIGKPWGSLYRRSVLSRYLFAVPRELNVGEDYIFWLRLVFHTEKPVNILNEQVYKKGKAHSGIKWTAEYALFVDNFRINSIPEELKAEYIKDITSDRLTNLFAVATDQPSKKWKHTSFYERIMDDINKYGITLPFKKIVFLKLPSRSLRRMYSATSRLVRKARQVFF